MIKISQKLKFLLVLLPITLTGCVTSVPLNSVNHEQALLNKNSVVVNTNKNFVANENNTSEINTKKVETKKLSNFKAIESVENRFLADAAIQKQVNKGSVSVDPEVKLIAPPTGLPNTTYVLPKVEEKEAYVPTVKEASPPKCVAQKNGKKTCQTVSKNLTSSIVKSKTPSAPISVKKVIKSSGSIKAKTTKKATEIKKETTTKKEKITKSTKKKS